jgi:hypothetical protein
LNKYPKTNYSTMMEEVSRKPTGTGKKLTKDSNDLPVRLHFYFEFFSNFQRFIE